MARRTETQTATIAVEWAEDDDGRGVLVCRTDDQRLPWSDAPDGEAPAEPLTIPWPARRELDGDEIAAAVDQALPEGWAITEETPWERDGDCFTLYADRLADTDAD